ncbi:MAG TPA: SRPBCC family protein [Actinomycetes bacterium]|nr:SRPBCC family protein [Actinomycetes bacterium]
MQLEHQFSVPVPVAQAWDLLLDVERTAPCVPGATVESFDGETIHGRLKVKVGPIQVTYAGTARFTEKDESARRAVLDASAKEARGPGTATAVITAALVDRGGSTDVTLTTDLQITGRPAQFGRGVMVEVGNKLLDKFADCLAAGLGVDPAPAAATAAPAAATAAPAAAAATPGEETKSAARDIAAGTAAAAPQATVPPPALRRVPAGGDDAVDVLDVARAPLLKRALPVVGVAVLLLVVWRLLARRRG